MARRRRRVLGRPHPGCPHPGERVGPAGRRARRRRALDPAVRGERRRHAPLPTGQRRFRLHDLQAGRRRGRRAGRRTGHVLQRAREPGERPRAVSPSRSLPRPETARPGSLTCGRARPGGSSPPRSGAPRPTPTSTGPQVVPTIRSGRPGFPVGPETVRGQHVGQPRRAAARPTSSPDDPSANDGDMFCADLTALPNGKILIAGGTDWYNEPVGHGPQPGRSGRRRHRRGRGSAERQPVRSRNRHLPAGRAHEVRPLVPPSGRRARTATPTVFGGVTRLLQQHPARQRPADRDVPRRHEHLGGELRRTGLRDRAPARPPDDPGAQRPVLLPGRRSDVGPVRRGRRRGPDGFLPVLRPEDEEVVGVGRGPARRPQRRLRAAPHDVAALRAR